MSGHHSLPSTSYTARRLEHATPEHLHHTTRRTFIGPIPEGWLKSHRKQWYNQFARSNRKRVPTFTAVAETQATDDAEERHGQDVGTSARPSSQLAEVTGLQGSTASTTSLLHSERASSSATPATTAATSLPPQNEQVEASASGAAQFNARQPPSRLDRVASKLPVPKVRFTEASKLQLRARATRLAAKGNFRSAKVKDGQMMKLDKMLVRIDITQQTIRDDYDEKASQGVETKSLDKWREFMVVARKHQEGDAEAVLQLYQTRVIAVSETGKVKKKPKVQIFLSNRLAKVNLYSALDKTLCIWTTNNMRTTIYYLRAQSSASAVEWFTFLRGLLGNKRSQTLQVNVPDLSVSLRLDDPFRSLEDSQSLADAVAGNDDALAKVISDEKGVAGAIVARCIHMLQRSPEWTEILKSWEKYDRIGLAWRRYDRLEWVYGAVEEGMYGTIAMQRTHDLELRPKSHYPNSLKLDNGKTLEEPAPVEGFLIRLTSQKGQERRLGKMLFKRLYFSTQNQYLLFLRPAKATPPRPPKIALQPDQSIPSTSDLITKVPLTYDVDPFPLDGKHIAWLDTEGVKSSKEQDDHDSAAAAEAQRNTAMILACDGLINLCDVQRVRSFQRGATPADENVDDGSDVDFHVEVSDSHQDDGTTNELQEDRVFELVMKNGLVIRLQAYNQAARTEWMNRVRQLVKYWTLRNKADMELYRSTRAQNLQELGIDERAEAVVGQFAHKWEVGKSYASPTLYNMCGISNCRTIHVSGTLFRKPRRHTTFTRCHVILSHGHLLIFQDTLRKRSGKRLVHIHHERIASISLEGCYLYSGLLTENDLLYQNRTFDSNAPGHHALPRMYLEDGWTSTDEDAMTTFVIWHAKSKSWFKSSSTVDDARDQEMQNDGNAPKGNREKAKMKLTRVSQLGATGRSVVFKARSRAERDHWVLAIQTEIERLVAQNDEVRIVENEGM